MQGPLNVKSKSIAQLRIKEVPDGMNEPMTLKCCVCMKLMALINYGYEIF